MYIYCETRITRDPSGKNPKPDCTPLTAINNILQGTYVTQPVLNDVATTILSKKASSKLPTTNTTNTSLIEQKYGSIFELSAANFKLISYILGADFNLKLEPIYLNSFCYKLFYPKRRKNRKLYPLSKLNLDHNLNCFLVNVVLANGQISWIVIRRVDSLNCYVSLYPQSKELNTTEENITNTTTTTEYLPIIPTSCLSRIFRKMRLIDRESFEAEEGIEDEDENEIISDDEEKINSPDVVKNEDNTNFSSQFTMDPLLVDIVNVLPKGVRLNTTTTENSGGDSNSSFCSIFVVIGDLPSTISSVSKAPFYRETFEYTNPADDREYADLAEERVEQRVKAMNLEEEIMNEVQEETGHVFEDEYFYKQRRIYFEGMPIRYIEDADSWEVRAREEHNVDYYDYSIENRIELFRNNNLFFVFDSYVDYLLNGAVISSIFSDDIDYRLIAKKVVLSRTFIAPIIDLDKLKNEDVFAEVEEDYAPVKCFCPKPCIHLFSYFWKKKEKIEDIQMIDEKIDGEKTEFQKREELYIHSLAEDLAIFDEKLDHLTNCTLLQPMSTPLSFSPNDLGGVGNDWVNHAIDICQSLKYDYSYERHFDSSETTSTYYAHGLKNSTEDDLVDESLIEWKNTILHLKDYQSRQLSSIETKQGNFLNFFQLLREIDNPNDAALCLYPLFPSVEISWDFSIKINSFYKLKNKDISISTSEISEELSRIIHEIFSLVQYPSSSVHRYEKIIRFLKSDEDVENQLFFQKIEDLILDLNPPDEIDWSEYKATKKEKKKLLQKRAETEEYNLHYFTNSLNASTAQISSKMKRTFYSEEKESNLILLVLLVQLIDLLIMKPNNLNLIKTDRNMFNIFVGDVVYLLNIVYTTLDQTISRKMKRNERKMLNFFKTPFNMTRPEKRKKKRRKIDAPKTTPKGRSESLKVTSDSLHKNSEIQKRAIRFSSNVVYTEMPVSPMGMNKGFSFEEEDVDHEEENVNNGSNDDLVNRGVINKLIKLKKEPSLDRASSGTGSPTPSTIGGSEKSFVFDSKVIPLKKGEDELDEITVGMLISTIDCLTNLLMILGND